jgi:hypothetical protein
MPASTPRRSEGERLVISSSVTAGLSRFRRVPFRIPNVLTRSVFTKPDKNSIETSSLSLSTNGTLFCVHASRSHWRPHCNDRATFLTPRINKVLRLARSRAFRAFHLCWKEHEDQLDQVLRGTAKRNSHLGETPIIRDTWTDNMKNNSRYIPGFQDRCVLPNDERFGPTRCQKPHPTIAVAHEDHIAFNFKSIVNYLNATTVVFMGMRTNLCIRSAATCLALTTVSVGYVGGLLDAGYDFSGQKKH